MLLHILTINQKKACFLFSSYCAENFYSIKFEVKLNYEVFNKSKLKLNNDGMDLFD